MYSFHVTTNSNIHLIYRDSKLKGHNWSLDWRNNRAKTIKHNLLISEENKISQPKITIKHIFRICAWREFYMAEYEHKQYNNVPGYPKTSVLRFLNQDIVNAGFHLSIDDKADYKNQADPAYLFWNIEDNRGTLSNNGLNLNCIEIYFDNDWVPLSEHILIQLQ